MHKSFGKDAKGTGENETESRRRGNMDPCEDETGVRRRPKVPSIHPAGAGTL